MANEYFEWRGIEGLVVAEVLEDSIEEYRTGEVMWLAGAAELSRSTESSEEVHYYDNIAATSVSSTGADEVSITTSAISMKMLSLITGQIYDETTGAYYEGERTPKKFALGYIAETTTGHKVYVWRYKGTFSIPDSTHTTKNDGTDANGNEVTYTGISTTHVFSKIGARVKAINLDITESKVDVSGFFDEVTTPDMLKLVTA